VKPAAQRRLAAEKFVEEWRGHGREDEDDQTFWNQFLQEVMGVARVHHEIDYQKKVKIIGAAGTGRIDAYIPSSKVLIEQKSLAIDLDAKQPGHDDLTPYEQAVRYAQNLPLTERPNYIIVSDFGSFRLYDTREDFNQAPVAVTLEELPDNLKVFDFIIREISEKIAKEEKANREAAQRIGDLYHRIAAQYPDLDAARHDLSILMVRILFGLYAEDSGLFDPDQFTTYLKARAADLSSLRHALIDIFAVLSTPPEARAANLDFNDALLQFPYVNGGLFEGEIEIPQLTDDIKLELLVSCANFNWSDISPVIFGSIFESILSGDERRAGGMHYTSPANIHKVIDPLFLDGLRSELNAAGHDKAKLLALQDKMASLKFLDPACGSGNFLTQTYIDLRRMENDLIERLHADGQMGLDYDTSSFIKVGVEQFYGIEINDFAVSVASTALWIADHQANRETSRILDHPYINLPLKKLHNIICENALRSDWNDLLPAGECSYVMGNPPFAGRRYRTQDQIKDVAQYFSYKDIDYVACWYKKATQYINETQVECAFVSTNSICQGEQVAALWKELITKYGIVINFAYQTFKWESESTGSAAVNCVIVGFSQHERAIKVLFPGNEEKKAVKAINGYLLDAPNIFLNIRSTPICDVPQMKNGNVPLDGDALKIEEADYCEFKDCTYVKRLMGGQELLHNQKRYVLWLVGASPAEVKKYPQVMRRIEMCRIARLNMKDAATRRLADTPMLFRDTNNPERYIALPMVSSERRKYVPMAYLDGSTIPTNQVQTIPDAALYHFGVLNSQFHNVWMRTVAGRLEMRYRYSKDIVYNNFIWPDASDEQKQEIEHLAQAVLDTRANYPESSLADLYDPLTMPSDLLKAHKTLDKAVEKAYRVKFNGNEEKIVAHLFKLYSQEIEGVNDDR